MKAEALGIRVVCGRFGIILAKQGGALPAMVMPFKVGLGAKLGDGRQWMPWVTLADVVSILQFAIEKSTVRGAINVVSPQPIRNVDFTQALANAIHRPTFLTAPALLLKWAMGEMSEAVLGSQRAVPRQLESLGFGFRDSELSIALRAILDDRR